MWPTEPTFTEHCTTENTVLSRVLLRNRAVRVHDEMYYQELAHMITDVEKFRLRRASDSSSLSPKA